VNEAALKNLERLSAFIYGDETGGAFAANLRAVMDEAVPSLRRARAVRSPALRHLRLPGLAAGAAFSEKDALLITYRGYALPCLRRFRRKRPFPAAQLPAPSRPDCFSYVTILPFFPYSSDDGFLCHRLPAGGSPPRFLERRGVYGGDFKLAST
jgi:hypothetical protein